PPGTSHPTWTSTRPCGSSMRCWSDRPPGASPGPRWSASCCGGSAPTAEAAGPPGRRPPCASRRVIRGTGPFEAPSRPTALAVQRRAPGRAQSQAPGRSVLGVVLVGLIRAAAAVAPAPGRLRGRGGPVIAALVVLVDLPVHRLEGALLLLLAGEQGAGDGSDLVLQVDLR